MAASLPLTVWMLFLALFEIPTLFNLILRSKLVCADFGFVKGSGDSFRRLFTVFVAMLAFVRAAFWFDPSPSVHA